MHKWGRLLRNSKSQNLKNPTSLNYEKKQTVKEEVHKDGEEYEIVEMEIVPEKIICPDCGGITLQGLEFCDKCGGEI